MDPVSPVSDGDVRQRIPTGRWGPVTRVFDPDVQCYVPLESMRRFLPIFFWLEEDGDIGTLYCDRQRNRQPCVWNPAVSATGQSATGAGGQLAGRQIHTFPVAALATGVMIAFILFRPCSVRVELSRIE